MAKFSSPPDATEHDIGCDCLATAMQEQTIADIINVLRSLNIPWAKIITTLIAQAPNIAAGNWSAVIMALMALVTG